MVQMSTSPVAGFSSPASPTLGLSGTVAAGVDDDQIDDEFRIEGHREQELALATRIAELSQDFLADSGVGLAAEHFDRMCEGFVTLQAPLAARTHHPAPLACTQHPSPNLNPTPNQDAYVEETQHFAAKSAGLAKAPVLRALSKLRFQNAGLKTQLEQNRIGAEMMGEQNRIQLEALRRQFRDAGMGFELQPVAAPAAKRKGSGDDAEAKARALQAKKDLDQARAEAGEHRREAEAAKNALDAQTQRAAELAAELKRSEAAHAAMAKELSDAQAREAALVRVRIRVNPCPCPKLEPNPNPDPNP